MMKRIGFNLYVSIGVAILLSLFLLSTTVKAQKTLGVGVSLPMTPNPNAALHVESPNNNQGIIIPRLSTAQRTAMTLSATDVGLIVYDTDLLDIVTWTGTGWDIAGVSSTASPAVNALTTGTGNAGTFTVNNGANNSAAIYATTNGTVGGNSAASAAILGETNTAFSAVTGLVNSGTPNAVSGITKSSDPGSWAGYFSALTGTAVYGTTSSNVGGALAPVGVYGESLGTGSNGGAFRINNAANNFSALYAETNGTGSSGFFKIANATNPAPVVYGESNGTGRGGLFYLTNAANVSPALQGRTVGDGAGVSGLNEGNGNGGRFEVTNVSNTSAALLAINSANGNAIESTAGGLRMATFDASGLTSITTRAMAYLVNTNGNFSFSTAEGETFYIFNNSASSVTINSIAVPANSGIVCIVIGGTLRGF